MEPSLEKQINDYITPSEVIDELRLIHTVMLTGITGAGKDTIIGNILEESDEFARIVTSTTRAPRENNGILEIDGREYYFLTQEQAMQKMANGEYVEVAPVHGRINGSLITEFRRISSIGKTALVDINYEGVSKFQTLSMEKMFVYFVLPPSFEVWLARIMKRQGGTIGNRDEILRRFRSALIELDNAQHQPSFIPIMNDVSRDTAQRIIEYTRTGTGPSEGERAAAYGAIEDLKNSIVRYIGQLEEA